MGGARFAPSRSIPRPWLRGMWKCSRTWCSPRSRKRRSARERVTACGVCGTLTDEDPCAICRDSRRDPSLLCVVEEAADVTAIERAGRFRGRYHVLGGRLSPLEGVGPDALRLDRLVDR